MKALSTILLATLIFFSSIGISVNQHFCKKEGLVVSYYFGGNDCACDKTVSEHSCCHEKPAKSCHSQEKDNGCCNHETQVYQLDVNYTVESESIYDNIDLTEYIAFFYSIFPPVQSLENPTQNNFVKESPPLLVQDISILHQVFLI